MWKALHDRRPLGHALEAADRRPVHRLLLWVLAAHVVGLAGLGIGLGHPPATVVLAVVAPAVCLAAGVLAPDRSTVSAVAVSVGLVCASAGLIGLTGLGAARFHVFVVIGLVGLYQSWAPLLTAAVLALAGQALAPRPGFPTTADPQDPGAWLPAVLFGGAVLALCVASALLWGIAERYRCERDEVGTALTEVELGRRRFVSELLINLARRSQGMVYRQLEILGKLQATEHDPDVLAELYRLDHLAVRVRRNAGNLLVLAGEQAPRTGGGPTSLREVVRAAVAETEDLDRVLFIVDEQRTVAGRAVADLTHLLAEVIENAVRFSPPDSAVTVRSRPEHGGLGRVVTVEDWGVGMPEAALAEANQVLTAPPEIDLSVNQRLGLHVVARLAARHRIEVALRPGDDGGTVCSIALPEGVFEADQAPAVEGGDGEPPAAEAGTDAADAAGTTRLPITPADPQPARPAAP
ncbi:sensor histidine kinase, partial [Pseudonocardia lacus]|uniref:sensor histidine kinase n=1 Tax=Pseudonocardia lacus TaxID=2835865 RepID=UPI002027C808